MGIGLIGESGLLAMVMANTCNTFANPRHLSYSHASQTLDSTSTGYPATWIMDDVIICYVFKRNVLMR